ncbi:hypothetical protein Bca4012_073176 [Brassica carinata]|uniref:BnaC05g29830D protein n=4 Tax=Brassica TaxID=3705 RepID=A0A078FA72_BRANA|nr:protein RDM1-like [Brassica napus]KAG2270942.1 hypothetical protein Bca52824_065497 [Brassica carinata]VDD45238.1 unnamed protein product [Brassica oleracea]KAH0879839.1 hypothetical protein HID58_067233 [Brassica napus]CAF1931085.1 unnamed protein product [Brassica napus]CDY10296.1 BnaC05g29830D [Brassica napus]
MQSDVTMNPRASDDSSSSDVEAEISDGDGFLPTDRPHTVAEDEVSLLIRAETYQGYMKELPLPTSRGSLIPFTSWVGLAMSIKELYGQPLHYLTNALLQRWDQARLGSDSEDQSLDLIIHPSKAEATIWLVEEIHRLTSSHPQIAELWGSDPTYHMLIDPIIPKLSQS